MKPQVVLVLSLSAFLISLSAARSFPDWSPDDVEANAEKWDWFTNSENPGQPAEKESLPSDLWDQPVQEEVDLADEQDSDDQPWALNDAEDQADFDSDNTEELEEPYVPSNEQEFSPDDLMIQFFNSPGDPDVLEQEVDWNDRDFLKEEYEQGLVQDSWGNDPIQMGDRQEEGNQQESNWDPDVFMERYGETREVDELPEAVAEDAMPWRSNDPALDHPAEAETEEDEEDEMPGVRLQDNMPWPSNDAFFQQPDPFKDESAFEQVFPAEDESVFQQGYPADAYRNDYRHETNSYFDRDNVNVAEEVWNEWNGDVETAQTQDDRVRINKKIDETYKQMVMVEAKLKELEAAQERAADLKECLTKLCSPCNVKQVCVRKNERGECISEEPKASQCCRQGYKERCKEMKEEAGERIKKEIEKKTAEMTAFQEELGKLTRDLQALEKNELNPSPK